VSPAPAAGGSARAYHDATKHTWQSVRAAGHELDWANKPRPFKVYPDLPAVPLPREVAAPAVPTLAALAAGAPAAGPAGLDVAALAAVLFYSAGLTRKKVYPGGEAIHFRAAASTGALYQTEVYVVAGAVAGLAPGVYHFGPGDFALRRLRAVDARAALAAAAGDPARVAGAPATLVLSAIHWRNAWKYRARAYRHFFWDAGTLLANTLATAAALDLPVRVLLGFADDAVDALLGLDPARESSLALVPLGAGAPAPPDPGPLPPLRPATVPLSPREADEPLIRAAVAASSLPDGAAAAAWSGTAGEPAGPGGVVPPAPRLPGDPLGPVILRRASTRVFARESIPREVLDAVLDAAVRDLPLDAAGPAAAGLLDLGLLVHAVDGLAPGAYALDRDRRVLRLLREGAFRAEGGYLCLEQPLGADASAVVFFLGDLARAAARLGDRGYRALNLLAGLLGGRLYLAAYALGLGATGLTFYDDDVVRFFGEAAAGRDAIFATALGRPARRGPATALRGLPARLEPLGPGRT
jgi:SagB-type dehydrogenase family enzyme